jgi:hypothetical protein
MSERITSRAIPLTLDGQEYQFRLDFTAMADFEQATGKGVLELFGEVFAAIQGAASTDLAGTLAGLRLKATDLQALTWACLGGEESGLSLREAGRLIHAGNVTQVVTALSQAIRSALPEPKPEGEQSHPPLPETTEGLTGSTSGPSPESTSD